ncbi:MAG TPA: DUF721 domain-containing protein [Chromatiales bacterium]|nr:DUF721 domain-containing protein [Thiotrichales bacterium]HIP69443.1 DUF721 domain-containing protein [Chromatiales bacterium]
MQPLKHYIGTELKEKAQANHLLNTVLKRLLPSPLNQHVWVVGIEKNSLQLMTDRAVWATRLRYQQRELLKQINSDPDLKLTEIEITVSSQASRISKHDQLQRKTLTTSAKKAIRNAALTVTDEEIRTIFEKIATR